MSAESKAAIETKDYWTFITLEVCGHVPTAIVAEEPESGRGCQLTYHFGEDAVENYEAWMRGAPGPVPKDGEEQNDMFDIIRKVQQSSTKFKSNLHRYYK